MKCRITNLSSQLLIMQLNSGKTVHLSPGETSQPIEHGELNGNAKIDKLSANNSIRVVQEPEQAAGASARPEPEKDHKRSGKTK